MLVQAFATARGIRLAANSGAAGRTRTDNLRITNALHYQLCYSGRNDEPRSCGVRNSAGSSGVPREPYPRPVRYPYSGTHGPFVPILRLLVLP